MKLFGMGTCLLEDQNVWTLLLLINDQHYSGSNADLHVYRLNFTFLFWYLCLRFCLLLCSLVLEFQSTLQSFFYYYMLNIASGVFILAKSEYSIE